MAFSALVAACGGGEQAAGPWRVGVVVDQSGPTRGFGESALRGVQLAAETLDAAGGAGRPRFELVIEDDRGSEEGARAAVEKLLASQVHALIGSATSSVTLAGAPLAQRAQVPMVTPSATSPEVTQVGDYIFRVCFVDTFQGEAMADFAYYSLRTRRAAVLFDPESAYGSGLARYFEGEFLKFGGETVAEQTYAAGEEDFSRQLAAIQAASPEVLFVPGYYTEAGRIAKQARELGLTAILLGGDGWDSPQIFELAGAAADGAYISTHFSPDAPSEVAPAFVAAYKARHGGQTPDAFAALAYDALHVLARAFERAGDPSGPALQKALGRTQMFEGVTGEITLNRGRDAIKDAVVLELREGGTIYRQNVSPLFVGQPS
jgi:branched-chain amino acid transport system substrate-binding protein